MILTKKLIFCFPYRGAGGVNMMFMRLASHLHRQGVQVALVDYEDGAMATGKDRDIELIPYFDDRPVLIPIDAIIVFQSMTPWSIFPSLRIAPETNLFFITTLPANFYPVLPGFLRNKMYEGGTIAKFFWHTLLRNEYGIAKRFLDLIESKNAHAILDTDIVCNLKQSLGAALPQPKLLPLFSDDTHSNGFLGKTRLNTDVLTLGWVGRLADFKITILNRVLLDAYEYASAHSQKIEFTVVGSGEYETLLADLKSDFFTIVKIPSVTPAELNGFLLKLDMLFAMGTTALEGAKLGVPTVRLDYSYSKIPEGYRYKFFHEIQGYSMGERIDSDCFRNGTHLFKDIMCVLRDGREELSQKGYDFYHAHHTIANSARLLMEYIGGSSLRWKDLSERGLLNSFLFDFWKNLRK